jgi:hydroxyacylglutathione hydrolase
LPEETVVLSGHGQETTIGAEMDANPFLHGF